MRLKRRQEDGFNLSFLDVMACGLGAVILIFILVDFDAFTDIPSEEKAQLDAELSAAQLAQQQLQESIQELDEKIAQELTRQAKSASQQSDIENQQSQLLQTLSEQLAVVAELEKQLAAVAQIETPDANINLTGQGEQNYITGLKVEGEHIGILVDKSASMLAENLVDVLRLIAKTEQERKSAAKWIRTKRVTQWLLARLPKSSKVTTVAFSDQAQVLGLRSVNSAASSEALNQINSDLNDVSPLGGTNLQLGLETLFQANPKITDVYLITDGLPTIGDGLGVKCRNVFKNNNTISSQCRQQLMIETIKRFPRGYRIHVILLPIDGDPYAASMYWSWTQVLGGTFLSPAKEWP